MSSGLRILLLIFSILWILGLLFLLKKGKIPVKYSIIWLTAIFILLLVAIFPTFFIRMTTLLGFQTTSNMIIGIILTLLLLITLVLTMIISNQKRLIKNLIQEVSIINEKISKKK